METAHLTPTRPAFTAGQSLWIALKEDYALYRRYRRTLKELRALQDFELADLSDFHRRPEDIAQAAVYGQPKQSPGLKLVWSA
ncbi:MAG: hypothetical protein AAF826_06670 [Pseudomonadota bacterium]